MTKNRNTPYFVTSTIVAWIPVFTHKDHFEILAGSLERQRVSAVAGGKLELPGQAVPKPELGNEGKPSQGSKQVQLPANPDRIQNDSSYPMSLSHQDFQRMDRLAGMRTAVFMRLSFGWLPGLMPATAAQATAPCNAGSCRRHAVGQRLRSALEKSEKILCGGAPVPCPCLPTRAAMAPDSGKPEAPKKHDG